jgi:TPR repeat protein
VKWIDRAAMAGHPQAESVMGAKYAEGDGVPEDAAFACFYWEAGAKNGWPGAQLNYGLRKISGEGTTPDRAEGIAWLKKAAEQGNESAVEELAKLGAG